MAKKRRRRTRQQRPATTATGPAASSNNTDTPEAPEDAAAIEAATEPRTRAGREAQPIPAGRWSERLRAASPYPRLTESLGRGLLAVGGSAGILLGILLFIGVLWLALVAIGLEVFPRTLVEALALPPVSSFYCDVLIPAGILGLSASAALITLVLTLVRALVWAVLVGAILEALEYGSVSMVGVLQGLRAFPSVLAIIGANVLAVIASNLILPGLLGPLGFLVFTAVLAGGLYFLPMAPAAAVRGPLKGAEAMRRSARAVRLPGSRHMVIFVLYFFVVLLLVALVPGGSIVTANPPIVEWVWVLAGTVVQIVFLAAFCYRWMVVEDQVPTSPPPRAPRRSILGGRPR